jgi:hypothetical protein
LLINFNGLFTVQFAEKSTVLSKFVSRQLAWAPSEGAGANGTGDFRTYFAPVGDGTDTCRIDVLIEEHEERTRAKARLSRAGRRPVGIGLARLDPADEPWPRSVTELAVARALSDLSNQLFALTSTDIQASTHEPVTGLHR